MYLEMAMYINSLPKTIQLCIYLGLFILILLLSFIDIMKNIKEE